MELGLSLGDSSIPPGNHGVGLCMALGISSEKQKPNKFSGDGADRRLLSLQLNLLPHSPVHVLSENGSSDGTMDLNKKKRYQPPPTATAAAEAEDEEEETDDGFVGISSPNSAASSFQMDFGMYNGGGGGVGGFRHDGANEDDNENGGGRKKLRLSKEQSAFLEESFKEHNTLNPKQKLALAKQLNLLPRQVEVWFQNRRARTKLKQTEVDCEYLKRCCETLTEENKRLHKELQELRALKSTNSNPFLMQLPATTLTMCPSCERVASSAVTGGGGGAPGGVIKPVSRSPMFFPFNSRSTSQPGRSSAAS